MKLHKKVKAYLPVISITMAVILFVIALAVSTGSYYQSRVLPKTYVAGTSISNLTVTNAQATVGQLAKQLEDRPLNISYNDQIITASPAQMGVTVDEIVDVPTSDGNPWRWLSYNFWRNFFTKKDVTLAYVSDDKKIADYLNKTFDVTTSPVDAKLAVSGGIISVVEGKNGVTIDTAPLVAVLTSTNSDTSTTITLTAKESSPAITNDQANKTKAQVESSLSPIYLVSNGQNITIPVSDLNNLLTFTNENSQITWQIDKTKLGSYLSTAIGRKVNITMLAQQIKSDTGEIITAGHDGSQLDNNKLVTLVLAAVTSKTDTHAKPITVPMNALAMATKTIYPDYQAGMFPGLYVYVNLTNQTMYVLNGTNLTNVFPVSSGAAGTPTPSGQYYVINKIALARSPLYKSLWMPEWNALSTTNDLSGYQGYGVHDLPCFDVACKSVEGVKDIGHPVSHGCVRLGHENAAWFYTNIPIGTPVYISK